MQSLIIAHDGTDEGAMDRRIAARQSHLEFCAQSLKDGNQYVGAAMLDDAGKMKGSVMIVDYPDRAAVDAWLAKEPYVVGKVWKNIEVIPCKIPDTFAHCIPKK